MFRKSQKLEPNFDFFFFFFFLFVKWAKVKFGDFIANPYAFNLAISM